MTDAAEAGPPKGSLSETAGTAVLGDRFQIDFGNALPALDSPGRKAFAAVDRKNPGKLVYALACRVDLPLRLRFAQSSIDRPVTGLVNCVGYGSVKMAEGYRPTLILERPLGGRLWKDWKGAEPMAEKEVVDKILVPLAVALDTLHQRSLRHRSVRPDNIMLADQGGTVFALGEAFSAPPGTLQRVAYEPLDRVMASPADRGQGHVSDDFFALGVTILALLIGKDPAVGRDDPVLAVQRVTTGSFSALIQGHSLSTPITELLRGLLADDAEDRWSMKEIRTWRDGRTNKPPRQVHERRGELPFRLGEQQLAQPRLLAIAFAANPGEAVKAMRKGQFDMWLKQSLRDPDAAETVEPLLKTGPGGTSAISDEILTTTVCTLLDPGGPIRYKALNVMPDGLGGVLAKAMGSGERAPVQAFAEFLNSEAVEKWAAMLRLRGRKAGDLEGDVRLYRSFLADGHLGGGMERCLYALNPGLPCQSRQVIDRAPLTLPELLVALDAAAEKAGAGNELIDRHVAAFVCSRSKPAEGSLQLALKGGPEDDAIKRLAGAAMLAVAQKQTGPPSLKNLTEWLAKRLGASLTQFHNREVRKAVGEEIERLASGGDVSALVALFADEKRRTADKKGYADAVDRYAALESDVVAIENGAEDRAARARGLGATIGFVLAYIALLGSMSVSIFGILLG
ncbi:MAG: hypothetical protein FJX46_12665 [Alphaproteobacteria bacterium]|nr:hypothetical protein [Alphaproteobacteria bacterium]